MKKHLLVVWVFLVTIVTVNVPLYAQDGPLLTPDNLDALSLTDTVEVGDIAELKFSADGHYMYLQSLSLNFISYDQQLEVLNHNPTLFVDEYIPAGEGFIINTINGRLDVTPQDQLRPIESYLNPPIRLDSRITALAFLESEQIILVGTADGDVYSYTYGLPPEIRTLWQAHDGTVQEILFLDDSILTLGQDNSLRWWDLTGQLLSELPLGENIITSLTTDGDSVFAIANDHTVLQIHDAGFEVIIQNDEVTYTDVLVFRELLVATDTDGQLSWFENGDIKQQNTISPLALKTLTTDPSTGYIATGGLDGYVYWVDQDGQVVKQIFPFTAVTMLDIAVSPDGQFLAVIGAKSVRLWDVQQKQWLFVKEISASTSLKALSYSSDGRWLAGVDEEGTIHVWDTTNAFAYHAISTSVDGISSIEFIDQSYQIAIFNTLTKKLEIWDVPIGVQVAVLQTEESYEKGVVDLASRDNLVVTIHNLGAVNYWLANTWELMPYWHNAEMEPHPIDVEFGLFDFNLFFLTDSLYDQDSSEIALWAVGTTEPKFGGDTTLPGFSEFEMVQETNVGVFLADDSFFVGFWDNNYFALHHMYDVGEETHSLSISERGDVVAVSAGAKVYIWTLEE